MSPLLSDDKQTHLSHVILDCFQKSTEGRLKGDAVLALKEIKRTLKVHMDLEQEIDRLVRKRLQSYTRKIHEGSPEWDVLYQKTYGEELRKRHLG